MANSKFRCPGCKEYYPSTEKVRLGNKHFHSEQCGIDWAANDAKRKAEREKEKKAKEQRKQDRETKRKLKTLSEWVSDAQTYVNKVVVAEDSPLGCISCGGEVTDAGHYFHRGSKYRTARLTLDRRNLTGQCRYCNSFKGGGNQHEYRLGYIKRYGEKAFDDLVELKRLTDCGEIPSLTIKECQQKIAEAKAKLKEIKTECT